MKISMGFMESPVDVDWTLITDDPNTWPPQDTVVMGTQIGWPGAITVRHVRTEVITSGTGLNIRYHRVSKFYMLPNEEPCHITRWRHQIPGIDTLE